MSVGCPSSHDLLRLLDGETTRNEEVPLRDHLAGCADCRRQSASLAQLLGDVAAPVAAVATANASVERVRQAIQSTSTAPSPRPAAHRALARLGGGFVVAAAAVALLIAGRFTSPDVAFQPRGGGARSDLARRVGIALYAPIGDALRDGATLPARAPLTAAYRNLETERSLRLLLFAIDARGEIHWLYPAYSSDGTDPEATHLGYSPSETALPESVVFEDPAPGAMRLVTVVTPTSLRVSAIEALAPDQLTRAALQRRWPDSLVEELNVVLVDDLTGPAHP